MLEVYLQPILQLGTLQFDLGIVNISPQLHVYLVRKKIFDLTEK